MFGRLPREIDPIRLAEEGAQLAGALPLSGFPRLYDKVSADARDEAVTIELSFERTVQGMRLMRGRLHTRLPVTCQSCLETVVLTLEARPFAELLRPGEPPVGAGDAEALTVEGPQLLSELVEEELLLVMPMVPRHDEGECTVPGAIGRAIPAPEKKPNPFAALRGRRAKDRQT